jgi:hypothetical protein
MGAIRMKLDHTPALFRAADFNEWLDFCLIGAEEAYKPMHIVTYQAMYDRPLTARQQEIRVSCAEAMGKRRAQDQGRPA